MQIIMTELAARAHSASPDALLDYMERIIERDESALESLYDATLSKVYGLSLKMTRRHDLAEEVVEDTYWQVWQDARKFDAQRGVPMAWIMTICRSRALDTLRRQPHEQIYLDEVANEALEQEAGGIVPIDRLIALERESTLYEAMKELSSTQQQLLALAFFKGYSHQEIADHTSMALGTVKSTIKRAQTALKAALESRGISHEKTS